MWSTGTAKFIILQVIWFCWLLLGLVVWPRLGDEFVSQNPRDVCACRLPEQILGCAYTIYSYCQISISCTISNGSPYPPSRAKSDTLSVLIYCIYYPSEFFTSALTDGFSQTSERLQINSNLRDFSKYPRLFEQFSRCSRFFFFFFFNSPNLFSWPLRTVAKGLKTLIL